MKSHIKEIMSNKGVTVRSLIEKIDELFPRTAKKGATLRTTSLTTIMNARDDTKIESCNLRTLKRIARALDVSVKDLFDDDITDDPHGAGSESID
jgi:predicted DNA-binding ribbon-helix-helix protein